MAEPTRYVLDTQCYIDLLRGTADGAAVGPFLATHVAAVDFHALVGAELRIGALSPGEATAIRQRLVDRCRPERLLVPDAADLPGRQRRDPAPARARRGPPGARAA